MADMDVDVDTGAASKKETKEGKQRFEVKKVCVAYQCSWGIKRRKTCYLCAVECCGPLGMGFVIIYPARRL